MDEWPNQECADYRRGRLSRPRGCQPLGRHRPRLAEVHLAPLDVEPCPAAGETHADRAKAEAKRNDNVAIRGGDRRLS